MRAKVSLTVEADVSRDARELGLNMSRIAEEAIAEAVRAERNRRWAEENRASLDAYADEIERDGLTLAAYRTF